MIGGAEQKLKCVPFRDDLGRFAQYSIHTIQSGVYDHFLIALLDNYSTLPDYRTLPLSEMRFLYRALVPFLKRVAAAPQA